MHKRTLATIGGVLAATLLIAGIAWASGSDDSSPGSTTPSTSTSLDDNGSSSSVAGNSSSTSLGGVTSTTIENNTSSTIDDDDTTSSTVDDEDLNDDRDKGDDDQNEAEGRPGGDDDTAVAVSDGTHTYQVAGAGSVTINVTNGVLVLTDVQPNSGWTSEVDKARSDRVKVKFRNGESEAEFEAEIEHGGITVNIEQGD